MTTCEPDPETWIIEQLLAKAVPGDRLIDRTAPWHLLNKHIRGEGAKPPIGIALAAMRYMTKNKLIPALVEPQTELSENEHLNSLVHGANAGNIYDAYALGKKYFTGKGVTKDLQKADELFAMCDKWHKALRRRGQICMQKKDLKAAYPLLRQAADKDDWVACTVLHDLLADPSFAANEMECSFAFYYVQRAANAGHPQACCSLAFAYRTGRQIGDCKMEKNYNLAAMWYARGAEKNHPRCLYRLGQCHSNGWLFPCSQAKGFELYKKAADAGDDCGTLVLGRCYLRGLAGALDEGKGDLPKDTKLGFSYVKKAAELGLAEAWYELGHCFMKGLGTEEDPIEAVKCWKKAADKGEKDARAALADYHTKEANKYAEVPK